VGVGLLEEEEDVEFCFLHEMHAISDIEIMNAETFIIIKLA